MKHSTSPILRLFLLCAATGFAATAVQATTTGPQAIYQHDRAACLNDVSPPERAACLKEAAAALQAARQGRLDTGTDAAQLRANALRRCEVHTGTDERLACERLVQGAGSESGSVAEGAVIHQLVTRSVGAPAK